MTVVPNGWTLYTPHDVAGLAKDALVIGPFGSNLKTSDYRDEGVPLVFVKDIRAEDFSRPRAHVSTAKAAELVAHQVLPGDILITKMGEPPGDAALYDSDVPGIITADCIRLRPTSEFDRKFLVHSLRTPNTRRQIDAITTGAAQQKVSLDRFRTRLHISAPPLAEQKRIAAVLDQVDTLRAKRREAITLLNDLAQSIFLDMFSALPASARLSDLAQVQSGLQLSGTRSSRPCEIPYLRVANVYRGYLQLDEIKKLRATPQEIERTRLEPGDLLIVEGHGNPNEIGRAALWDGSIGNCTHQNHLIRIRVDREQLIPEYLEMYLNSTEGRRHLLSSANTTSGLNTISTGAVKRNPIPVPSMDEQLILLGRLEQLRRTMQRHRTHLAALDELFGSLQQRAFAGTLWNHDGEANAA